MAVAYGAKLQKIDGKDCYQIKETNKTEKDEVAYLVDYDYGYVSKDTYYDIEDTEVLEDDTVSMYNIPASAVTMTMTITFPAKVVRTNGTIDPANPNKVSFSIPYNKKTEIFATTNPKNTISSIKAKIKASNTIKKPKIKKLKANKVAKKAKKATVSLKIGKVKGAKKKEYKILCTRFCNEEKLKRRICI